METKSKMDELAGDVEKQQSLLLSVAAAGEKLSSGCEAFPRASPTASRTLALVVLVAGAAFAAQLAAHEEYVLLAIFASQLASFCVFTSLLAVCALPEDTCGRRARWGARAAGQVLQWSLAMAVPASMAFWVIQSAPAAVGAAMAGLASLTLSASSEFWHVLASSDFG